MRTHKQIVKDSGGDALIGKLGIDVSVWTVRAWRARNSIPGPYWQAFADHGLATLAELAAEADCRRAANDTDPHSEAAYCVTSPPLPSG